MPHAPDPPMMPPSGASTGAADEPDALSQVAARHLAVAMSLRATAWALSIAGVRAFRPELSDAQVLDVVRAQFRRATG